MRELGRKSELGRINEFSEKNNIEDSEYMARRAEEILRMLKKIELSDDFEDEKTRETVFGIDQEAVRKGESREYKIDYNDVKKQYLDAVVELADEREWPEFWEHLKENVTKFNLYGLNVTPESMLADIDAKINEPDFQEKRAQRIADETECQIEALRSVLDGLFDDIDKEDEFGSRRFR